MCETAIVEDFEQLVEGDVAVSESIGGLRNKVVMPVAVAQLLLRAGADREDPPGFRTLANSWKARRWAGNPSEASSGRWCSTWLIITPSRVASSKGSSSILEE